jgi:predicted ATPase
MHNNFPKGSCWRKWDLHVHTPASILNQNFGSDWDSYVQKLFKKAIQLEIEAIGITDYFSIDGYTILKQSYLNNKVKLAELFEPDEVERINRILVFPNIEFRIDKLVVNHSLNDKFNKKVNYHLLLSDSISIEDIQENLLHGIEFETLNIPGQPSQRRKLSKRNLEEFGAALKKQHVPFQQHSDIYVGMMNATVSASQIQSVLQSQATIFQGNYLFALPADEDLSLVSWNSGGHSERKFLIQKANFIFSGNPNTVNFGLGKIHPTEKDFVDEFTSLKPCLWGSDAHDYDKLFLPDEGRNTWVKADLTFEGLKSVIFEPEGRVLIQESHPETKPSYLVIDKVRYTDETGKDIFGNELIEFNENLNAIIGGKSSGKSLLLYHIAKAIDPNQVHEKSQESISDYNKFRTDNPFNIEVVWKDGTINTLNDSEEKNGQITYIPQLYINHLAEKEGRDELYKLIENILLQNELFKQFKEEFETKKQELKDNIYNCIQELLRLTNSVDSKQKEIQQIGTEQQLSTEKDRLIKQVELLTKQSGLTPEQAARYNYLEDEKRKYEAALKRANERVSHYKKMQESFQKIQSSLTMSIKEKVEEFSIADDADYQKFVAESSDVLVLDISNSFAVFSQKVEAKVTEIDSKISTGQKKLEEINSELKPFVEVAKNRELLKDEQKKLTNIEAKLTLLKSELEKLDKLKEQGRKNNEKLFESYSSLFEIYKTLLVEMKKPEYCQIDTDLILNSRLRFDIGGFSNSFSRLFDNRGNFNQIFNQTFDLENQFIYSEQQHVGNIRTIFDKIRSRSETSLRLRVNMNEDEKYQRLFEDYFTIDYTVEHRGDDILSMSPGKRGLVLLQLILHISTATHPILIDQPEDNLDNRTIFFDLKNFIKSKKRSRQIIIVTHNANLVVATDAECIIVANQDGQQQGKDNKSYKFEYVSGSLENTFVSETENGVLFQKGIKEHVCDILEGGKEAFLKREQKYGFSHMK